MRHHFSRFLVCAALAGSASLTAAVIPGGIAGAATQLTVTCTSLTGSNTSQTASGCSGADVSQTGTHGTITPKVSTTTKKGTATITWATGKTTIESTSYVTSSDTSCPTKPGYTKLARATTTSVVTGGTATKLIGPKKFTAVSCEYAKGGLKVFNVGKDTY